MGVGTIVGLAIAVLAVSLLICAAILRLCGYALSFPRATWGRSLLTAMALWGLLTSVGTLAYIAPAAGWVLFLTEILLAYFVIRGMIGTTRGRSWVATMLWLVGSVSAGFGLAILVRDFLVEAFVVPTGGLATTILGLHADVTCENCGCQFPIGMSAYARLPYARLPFGVEPMNEKEVVCRNCGHQQTYQFGGEPLRGDRILVDKTAFPRRWDLAVFWYPPRGQELAPEEREPGGSARVTYVKRLVGLPSETLQLADGDLFVNGRRLRKRPGEQEDLWFTLFESRHVPKASPQPVWKPKTQPTRWKFDDEVAFDGESDEREELEFGRPINTFLAYNAPSSSLDVPAEVNFTGDVRFTCELAEFSGAGGFGFSWSYGGATVRATVAASGETSLTVSGSSSEDDHEIALEAPRSVAARQRWSFAHRDGRAYVEQDGRVVSSRLVGSDRIDGAAARSPRDGPSLSSESACRVGLLAERCRVRFSQVQIERDVYYIAPGEVVGESAPGQTYRLGEGEYFLLGDNSPHSQDSRVWGALHEADFVGVVRTIFWPPSRWRAFP